MARPRDSLPRLTVNPPLSIQQPISLAYSSGQTLFSPALPTSIQQTFHPPFPGHGSLQTPMQQSFFNPQLPPAPSRPIHHQNHASVAHLAAAGIHPPGPFPITPVGGHFPRPSMMGIPGQVHQHPRNRRQLSIGGPPKAVLGGPARKLSPLIPSNVVGPALAIKLKKVNVNIPKETVPGEDDQSPTRPPWARIVTDGFMFEDVEVLPVKASSIEQYPPDIFRHHIPSTLDVFLPGRDNWDLMKQRIIEEKLEKLGVEPGSGSNAPHIFAPHARAASISSPADPQLLLFKLNKLQQSQEAAASNAVAASLTPSPRPSLSHGFSLANSHGYTMSLANTSSNAFAQYSGPEPEGLIATPEAPLLNPPAMSSRPNSRPDFVRGFGLDIPEEAEEEDAQADELVVNEEPPNETDVTQDMELDSEGEHIEGSQTHGAPSTAAQSRIHSRHISKLSAALSVQSANNLEDEDELEEERIISTATEEPVLNSHVADMEEDAIGEWTGSEDVYMGEESSEGGESIGEWSNPSDEERARQERLERRNRRRAVRQLDRPRRLPDFPRPPENNIAVPFRGDEEDMISNPSEEGNIHIQSHGDFLGVEYYSRPSSNLSTSRPLPPIPHSRNTSGQHTAHDPAHAHSRSPSDQFVYPFQSEPQAQPSLNPFAKPFVFGAQRLSGSWDQRSANDAQTPPTAPLMSHVRFPSVGKPLNVAAPEFKPSGFTFRPPPGVPQMPQPLIDFETSRPLPQIPTSESSPLRVQGREKRQRRGSTSSIEEGNSMASFRFPKNLTSPPSMRRSAPVVADAADDGIPAPILSESPRPVQIGESLEETLNDDSTAKADNGDARLDDIHLPSTSKPKRAPIPLDFKHPVSKNTMPAGLFKALVNGGDERTRRTVRSRLSSREIFEHLHRPSMDDTDVPTISRQLSRSRLVTDPGPGSPGDPFGPIHSRRRSSLPDALHDDDADANAASDVTSNPALDLTSRLETQKYDSKVTSTIDHALSALSRDLSEEALKQHSTTQAMIADIQSMFRTQLQTYAARSLDDSQMDARGEMDFELFRDIVQEGNNALLEQVRRGFRDLQRVSHNVDNVPSLAPVIERVSDKTINAIVEALSEFSARQETITRTAPARERDAIVDKIVTGLNPVLTSLRSEPINYEFLTNQLTQAVKPEIAQLIDLASDKRETAGLIVDKILPLLPKQPQALDTDALTIQLTTEIRRAIAPIDAFEIKEQVADLVVERLDSRLAVRDKALNVENVTTKVVESVSPLLIPVQGVLENVKQIADSQENLLSSHSSILSRQDQTISLMSKLPSEIKEQMEGLRSSQADSLARLEAQIAKVVEPNPDVLAVQNGIDNLSSKLDSQSEELRSLQGAFEKVQALPDALTTITNYSERLGSQDSLRREVDELRKLNGEYQVQMTKARAAHGQVRVEKDVLNEKLVNAENDRQKLRSQVDELHNAATIKDTQISALEGKNAELEEALTKALSRLQASDVAAQAQQTRINELDQSNREVMAENALLKGKLDSLELKVTFAVRDKDVATQALETLQKQHETLFIQRDGVQHLTEKLDALANVINQADKEELKELRRYRDRGKVLEGEHAALQKRFKEQESKVSSSEKAAATARQSLAQAQQRASEWERRARDHEGQLEATQTKLDQAEQTLSQLEADHSLLKMQLEEREAEDRLTKDQLREHIAALEAKCGHMQIELEKAKTAPIAPPHQTPRASTIYAPPRPDSRTSTIYDRSPTPQLTRVQSISPLPSVRDSMHAPSKDKRTSALQNGRYSILGPATPRARHPHHYRSLASPTPSIVSLAPTQDEDGWWS